MSLVRWHIRRGWQESLILLAKLVEPEIAD